MTSLFTSLERLPDTLRRSTLVRVPLILSPPRTLSPGLFSSKLHLSKPATSMRMPDPRYSKDFSSREHPFVALRLSQSRPPCLQDDEHANEQGKD